MKRSSSLRFLAIPAGLALFIDCSGKYTVNGGAGAASTGTGARGPGTSAAGGSTAASAAGGSTAVSAFGGDASVAGTTSIEFDGGGAQGGTVSVTADAMTTTQYLSNGSGVLTDPAILAQDISGRGEPSSLSMPTLPSQLAGSRAA